MMEVCNKAIITMLNRPYGTDLKGQGRKFICWHFCKEVYKILGLELQHLNDQRELNRIAQPVVPCIVLFRAVVDWHSGVVWPDGLHFIHACPKDIVAVHPGEYVVHKDRLTIWPYNLLIEGYYVP